MSIPPRPPAVAAGGMFPDPPPGRNSHKNKGAGSSAESVNCREWREALKYLSLRIKKRSFATWFEQTRGRFVENAISGDPGGNCERILEISTPSQFVADWIRDNYHDLVEEALYETSGRRIPITLGISASEGEARQTEFTFGQSSVDTGVSSPTVSALAHAPTAARPKLHERYRFEQLVVGAFNEFAFAACVAVADKPGTTKYNPLVIYGGVGLGKTHLMQSVGQAVIERRPGARVKYATSEEFTNDFIDSLSNKTISDFTNSYRSVDVLLIDDIQFLSGKESTQEQFFHTFNALYNSGKQIVLTADRRPQDIKGLEQRLLSRFSSGLVTDIQSPDLEARIAILKKKLEEYDFQVGEEILLYIASRITSNVRELEGALTHLYARASVENVTQVSREYTERALADVLSSRLKHVTVDTIQQRVAESFGVSVNLLKSKKRTAHVALARQVGMYLVRSITGRSLQQIGSDFGGRDHSTVIHACSLIASKMEKDAEFSATVNSIIEDCR